MSASLSTGTRELHRTAARRAADGLALAASPTFALMALSVGAWGTDVGQMLCAGEPGLQIGGMAAMYVLMSVFHLAPWLRLVQIGKREAT
ncbi:hypothetical protein PWG15_22335 (plasmid) [Ensifer adhaerens]|uniref:hypothetical protein n=1 Tax=Ensifer adhaerens TaxID=106592 RepID=UPI0023A91F54|nr:hypothetical protein [Ensifer adhaerens]WDZ80523.1 hypothetical protein PWG15_22335 [Ensifer adhaerens]